MRRSRGPLEHWRICVIVSHRQRDHIVPGTMRPAARRQSQRVGIPNRPVSTLRLTSTRTKEGSWQRKKRPQQSSAASRRPRCGAIASSRSGIQAIHRTPSACSSAQKRTRSDDVRHRTRRAQREKCPVGCTQSSAALYRARATQPKAAPPPTVKKMMKHRPVLASSAAYTATLALCTRTPIFSLRGPRMVPYPATKRQCTPSP